jgi:hypothetical protein
MVISLSLPLRREGTEAASSLGFPQAALIFLNWQAVASPTIAPA